MTGRAVLLKSVRTDLLAVVPASAVAVEASVDPWEAVVALVDLWEVVADLQDVVGSVVVSAAAVGSVALLKVVPLTAATLADLTRFPLFPLVPPTLSLTTLLQMATRVL
jgi:hypothetical protein